MFSLAPERWWPNGPYAAERLERRNGRVLVRSVAHRSGVAFTPCEYSISLFSIMEIVKIAKNAIFDSRKGDGDCRTSQQAKKLDCRRRGLPFVSVGVRSVTLD